MSNNGMPKQVEEANRKADEALRAMDQAQEESKANLVTFDDDTSAPEELEDTIDSSILVTTTEASTGEEDYIGQDTLESPEEVDEQPLEDDLQEQLRKSRAQYSSIRGKYNTEGQKQREEIARLKAQLAERPVMEPTSVQQEVNDDDDFSYLSESAREAYDPEFLATMKEIAKNQTKGNSAEVARLKQELAQKDQQQMQNQANDDFMRTLSELAPNWSELNNDPEFSDWLDNTTLPIVGNAREAMDEFNQLDNVYAVAEIFNSYSPLKKKNSNAKKGINVPEAQLSPPKASGTKAISSAPVKNTYNGAFLREFYKGAATGTVVVRGKKLSQSEIDFISKDIDAAQLEDRIIP